MSFLVYENHHPNIETPHQELGDRNPTPLLHWYINLTGNLHLGQFSCQFRLIRSMNKIIRCRSQSPLVRNACFILLCRMTPELQTLTSLGQLTIHLDQPQTKTGFRQWYVHKRKIDLDVQYSEAFKRQEDLSILNYSKGVTNNLVHGCWLCDHHAELCTNHPPGFPHAASLQQFNLDSGS